MDGINLGWTVTVAVPVLALHLVSVTLTRALRTYSRSRLEDLCARRGHPGRADDVAHEDERTERAAEVLAVVTGLMLAALLGVMTERRAPHMADKAVLAIALAVGAVGYVLAGVVGRVFAEAVLDRLWPRRPPPAGDLPADVRRTGRSRRSSSGWRTSPTRPPGRRASRSRSPATPTTPTTTRPTSPSRPASCSSTPSP